MNLGHQSSRSTMLLVVASTAQQHEIVQVVVASAASMNDVVDIPNTGISSSAILTLSAITIENEEFSPLPIFWEFAVHSVTGVQRLDALEIS